MIFRIATGLARNSAPEHRWRRVAVPITAAFFVLLVLAGSSVVMMTSRGAQRELMRTPAPAEEPSRGDLFMLWGDDVWDGRQFFVYWIEPASDDEPVLPPGVQRLPQPGQALVSPALDRLAARHPDVAARYPDRQVIGKEGIRSEEELFAYVRAQEGRSIKEDGSAVRVRGFGPRVSGAQPMLSPDAYSGAPVAVVFVGVLGFMVLPGLVVLAVGVAAASGVRDRRFEVLSWIGVPRRTLAALSLLETMILAVPGMIVVTALWAFVAPRLGWVPLVGHDAVRGDLALPWRLLLELLAACIATIGLVSISVTVVFRGRRQSRTRPDPGTSPITPLRVVPLVLVIVALALGTINRGSVTASYLYVCAMALAVVAVPLILPGALRSTGRKIGRLNSVSAFVVGRGMEWDPIRTSRPFMGVASLIVIALLGSMFISLARGGALQETPLPEGGAQAVFLEWRDARPSDLRQLAVQMESGLVAPFSQRARGSRSILSVGATCEQLTPYLSGTQCDATRPYELPVQTERWLAGMLAPALSDPNVTTRLAPAESIASDGKALVFDKAPLAALEDRVRTAAGAQGLPAPYAYSALSFMPQQSALAPWMIGGISAAVIALGIGCLVALIDRLLGTREHQRHLLNLGTSPRRLIALETWQFAVPYAVALVVAFSTGLAICVLVTVLGDAGMPWGGIGVTLVAAVCAGLLGSASVAAFGARGTHEVSD